MRGRGGSSCRFERIFGKTKRLFVGTATQVKLEENNLNGERGEKTLYDQVGLPGTRYLVYNTTE